MFAYIPQKLQLQSRYNRLQRIFKQSDLPNPTDIQSIIRFISQQDIGVPAQNTRQLLTNWLTQCTPTILAQYNKHAQSHYYHFLYIFSVKLKYHHTRYYHIAEQYWHKERMRTSYMQTLIKIYMSAVFLKHGENKNFIKLLRNQIIDKIKKMQVLERNNIMTVCTFMEALGLDRDVSVDEKNQIYKLLDPVFQASVGTFSAMPFAGNYCNLFQIATLYNLKINRKLMAIFQKCHSQYETISNHTINEEFDKNFMSVFQKIFQNKLYDLGYRFDINTIIKGRQYDFIINGRRKEKNRPLAHIDLENPTVGSLPALSFEKVDQLSRLAKIEWIEKESDMEKVVLSLNGPLHYILSNTHPEQTITRLQQFSYEKLALYGIYKYNIINYNKWQKISRFTRDLEQFIHNKINNPICLAKTF